MGVKGVEKFTVLRILTSGNDGFQVIMYPVKNGFMYVCICKRERAPGTASAQIQLVGMGEFKACGVQAWKQHRKNIKINFYLNSSVLQSGREKKKKLY